MNPGFKLNYVSNMVYLLNKSVLNKLGFKLDYTSNMVLSGNNILNTFSMAPKWPIFLQSWSMVKQSIAYTPHEFAERKKLRQQLAV